MDYFFDRVGAVRGADKAGEHFVAVTDPGSSLEQARQGSSASRISSIGVPGDRRALFGAVEFRPGAGGGDGPRRQAPARDDAADGRACGADVPPAENPGVQLGIALGVAATRFGRDKVTIIASPGIADLGAWLEQLLAESTGKQARA